MRHPSEQLLYTAAHDRKKGFEPHLFLNQSQNSRPKLPPGKAGGDVMSTIGSRFASAALAKTSTSV